MERLERRVLFSESLAAELAACFADAPDEELVALGECFAFDTCVVRKDLCEVLALSGEGEWLPQGTTKVVVDLGGKA